MEEHSQHNERETPLFCSRQSRIHTPFSRRWRQRVNNYLATLWLVNKLHVHTHTYKYELLFQTSRDYYYNMNVMEWAYLF